MDTETTSTSTEAPEPTPFGDVALYLLSRITKLYRSWEGADNELTRHASQPCVE